MSLFNKIFGDTNSRVINKIKPIIDQVNQLEPSLHSLTDDQLKIKTTELKTKIAAGTSVDEVMVEAFGLIRESIKRTVGQRAYDVQLMSAYVLHQGKIAEQKTGEGKTLSAVIAAFLNALEGQGVHIITVNDYLAKRDAGWYGIALHRLGMTVGCITHEQASVFDPDYSSSTPTDDRLSHLKPVERREAYLADILYGTNNEFGFDYLRDNMVPSLQYMVQRDLHYAIVDEVDSILIDEARTPLIISAPVEESTSRYHEFAQHVSHLEENSDYNIDEKMRAATLTESGIAKMEKWLGIKNIYEAEGIETVHHIEQALKAKALFKKDKDYVVKEGEIIIVDEFTGRLMFGRRYSEGLHQAIEAKENVDIKQESQTLATVTFQNYFRLYKKLAGMTGTAATEAEEFHKIYMLEVVVIPTNQTMKRIDSQDRVYKTTLGKYQEIVREIKVRHELGQPLLIGTVSIEKNELLSKLLEREGVEHNLLNAKNHEKEASIIAQAGRFGAVTVATNMAGRGVDIILGGNPQDPDEQRKVLSAGGLHVIGTERHESRRIDNQLRGRSGRQGDPGSSQFFVSMEDDLMRIFGSDRMKSIMDRLGVPEDMPIENSLISKSIESAQKKVEGHNFDIRKHLVEYDDIINKHREVIYKKRRDILSIAEKHHTTTLRKQILELVEKEIEQIVLFHTSTEDEHVWDLDEIYNVIDTVFPVSLENRIRLEDMREKAGDRLHDAESRTAIINYLTRLSELTYDALEKKIQDENIMRQVEKAVYIRAMDTLWIEHLDLIDHLRQGIGLRGYGQQDPLVEYKKEAYRLFNELINNIQKNIVYTIFKINPTATIKEPSLHVRPQHFTAPTKNGDQISSINETDAPPTKKIPDVITQSVGQTKQTIAGNLVDTQGEKIGRNNPCPCGSGKKYKQCHGK